MSRIGQGQNKEKLFTTAVNDGSLERWARAGATDKQIAENMGLSRDTFYRYLKLYPDTSDILQRARKPVVIEAFEGLVRLSRGYHEKKISKHQRIVTHADGTKDRIEEIYEDDEYYPPNHQACTKVIVNYLNQQSKQKQGVPDEYLSEPIPSQQEIKQGRFPEMEEALKSLFFNEKEQANDQD